ncbi:ABC transporter permease [Metabacillus halosaccharovorans]|uniref:ABC transporter permease n=1 Tax=Metabacillus halosaccharovorans TaxID=930124 RepID=A0ABT3DGD1_9BACI|nr:ABC transporter permease [Metabacillus halosaccharovorans]MCV9885591.1 ABC transporter permease [Metabacillus halosaccharovorans]
MSQKTSIEQTVINGNSTNKRHELPFRFEYDPHKKSHSILVPVISIIVALILCGLFILLNGLNPITVYMKMLQGAFGSSFGISETLVKATPLLLCGLGVAIAYRISIWNIGAEGQFLLGAIGATAITIYFPQLPGVVYIPLMIIVGIVSGALWGLLTAIPRTYFQVNELITSLMLNYVALLLLDYFVFGPWRDPEGFNFPGTPMFVPSQLLATIGSGTRLHIGLFFAIIAVFLFAFFTLKTRWGYELRLLGANPTAAKYAGIRINKHILIVMMISGGLAGLGGMVEVSGVAGRLMYGISPGYGYTAIIVAWLAKLNPFAMILSSVFIGGLIVGGYSVQTIGLPSTLSFMLQGAILFCLIGGEMISKYRVKKVYKENS